MNMKRALFLFSIFLFVCSSINAQTDSILFRFRQFMQNIHSFNHLYPQEKVWLHCDNTAYFQGDTIWFAAYVTSAETLRPAADLSKVLYVELINEIGEVISVQRLSIKDGRCHGQIALNKELEKRFVDDKNEYKSYRINPKTGNPFIPYSSGFYEVRAYTRSMLNWGKEVCFSRVFPVFDLPEREGDYSQPTMKNRELRKERTRPILRKGKQINADFYPEGGNLIEGRPCRLAFKITDSQGKPVNAKVELWKNKKLLTEALTIHDGMGSIQFIPEIKADFQIQVQTDKRTRKFDLPPIQSQGATLHVEVNQNDSVQAVVSLTDSLCNKPFGLSIICRGKLLYFQVYDNCPKYLVRLLDIPKSSLSIGVNQMTLFDADGRIYAERLFFVEDSISIKKNSVQYQWDKKEYAPFDPITLTLQAHGGIASVAIRDSAYDVGTNYYDNLQSYLLLTSELKGYIHHPEYYFEKNDSVHRAALDLLMMTQGWRRYEWKTLAGIKPLETTHFIEEGLSLKGKIMHHKKNKYLKGVKVSAVVSKGKQIEQSGKVITDSAGNYAFTVKAFEGQRKLSLSLTDGKDKIIKGRILIDRHFSPTLRAFSTQERQILFTPQFRQNIDSIHIGGTNVLGDINITGRKKSIAQFILHDIRSEREADLDKGVKISKVPNIGGYIAEKYNVPDENLYGLLWCVNVNGTAQEDSIDSENYQTVFIPKQPVPEIRLINADYIKVYTTPYAHRYVKMKGYVNPNDKRMMVTVWIYKKPVEISGLRTTHIDGYSEVIDYYHPQYNREIIPGEVDYRRTLYWNPHLPIDGSGKTIITFYNNGVCKRPTVDLQMLF